VVTTVEVPVAVVGAGPVGMTAALAFARQGVPVTVLEADEPGVRAEWRGSTLHPPTLELLDRIGILESVVAGCVRVDRVQYRDLESDAVATFDYAALAGHTAVPFRAQFEQYKLLRLLRTAVTETPDIDVRHASRVMDSREDGEHLTLTVVPGDGVPYEVRARWVIAADGAHSTMRKLAGIDFPGTTYPTMSLVAATRFPFEEAVADLAPVTYVSGPQGRLSLIRTPDTWRIAVSTDVDSGGATPDAWRAEEPHPSLREALDLLVGGRAWAAEPLEQHQFYRSHQRVAGAFRAGRVLLVGDAAHLTSTTGGMGLNSGVHDAFDLAARRRRMPGNAGRSRSTSSSLIPAPRAPAWTRATGTSAWADSRSCSAMPRTRPHGCATCVRPACSPRTVPGSPRPPHLPRTLRGYDCGPVADHR
jgi:3-(3-hydroxy-phenyl)propionate hydroxylase